MSKPLINVTRLAGVEAQLKRLNELIEILLNHQGIITKPGAKPDDSGVTYSNEDSIMARELLESIGKLAAEEPEE